MKLSSMSYKGYVWPHNPRSCTVTTEKSVTTSKLPGGRWHTGEYGLSGRKISGSGEFSGEGAYSRFMELYEVFCQDGEGILYHPVLGAITAHFSSLTMDQEPSANYVAYSFEFLERGQSGKPEVIGTNGNEKKYHTVAMGESFWTICSLYDLTALELVNMNPTISSPVEVTAGMNLRVK